jgi:hypothetical protein
LDILCSNWIVNRVNAALQSLSGIVHFTLMLGQSQIEQFQQRIVTRKRFPILGEHLEQAVLTDEAFGVSVVSQQAVDQFVRDGP